MYYLLDTQCRKTLASAVTSHGPHWGVWQWIQYM